jgi:hypothetical protein
VAFAALARLSERSVLRVRLVNGGWATLRGVRTEPGAAETLSVIIGSPDAEQLSRVMAAIYGLTPRAAGRRTRLEGLAPVTLRGFSASRALAFGRC